MSGGWLIGVLVQPPGEPKPLRHYFAIGHADQGKCEWTAVDLAREAGRIAEWPIAGEEPVAAIRALSPASMKTLGLEPGQAKALGWRNIRRWLTA